MLARPARVLVSLFALRALDAGVQAREVLPNRTVVLSLASGAEVRRATLARHWARFDAPPLRFWDAFTGDQHEQSLCSHAGVMRSPSTVTLSPGTHVAR